MDLTETALFIFFQESLLKEHGWMEDAMRMAQTCLLILRRNMKDIPNGLCSFNIPSEIEDDFPST